jgi:hypothetical protein
MGSDNPDGCADQFEKKCGPKKHAPRKKCTHPSGCYNFAVLRM